MIYFFFTNSFKILFYSSVPRIDDIDSLRAEVTNRLKVQQITCGETETKKEINNHFDNFFEEILQAEEKKGTRFANEDILSQLNAKMDMIFKENLNWVFVFSRIRSLDDYNKFHKPIFLRKDVVIFDGYYSKIFRNQNYFSMRYFAQGQMIDDSYPMQVKNHGYLQYLDTNISTAFKDFKLDETSDMPQRKPVLIYFIYGRSDSKIFYLGTSPRRSVFTETVNVAPSGRDPQYITALIQ